MQSKTKNHSLHTPKITPIPKQQYRRFHAVRQLKSPCMGVYSLLAYSQNKYMSINLPISTNFLTTRSNTHHIYHYTEQSNNTYIFQLIGQPLSDIWRGHFGTQIKEWMDAVGGLGNAMMQLLISCIKMYTEDGIQDVMAEWWRVGGGKLICCYDTWMKSSCQIIAEDAMEIQNYFLTQTQLSYIQTSHSNQNPPTVSLKQYLFKLGLFVISLCLPEVKIRNYQYCQYKLSQTNIEQKLNLFKIKMSNKQLISLVSKFIKCQIQTMQQVWKILDNGKIRGESPLIYKHTNQNNGGRKSLTKSKQNCDKQNSMLSDIGNIGTASKHSRKFSSITKAQQIIHVNSSNYKKIKLRNRNSQSINMSSLPQQQVQKQKKVFSLKQLMSKPFSHNCQKLIEYLGLSQHIHESTYQSNIIKSLQQIRIKPDWQHKIYANGSIYIGQLNDQKREGKGVYLFDSEDLYVGDWKDNFMSGNGCYVFRSGQLYEGELRKGNKYGFGRFYYQDGRIYEGHWQDNFKFGFGTVLFPNSTKFIGFFNKLNQTYGLFTILKQQQLKEFQGNLESYNWQTNTFNSSQICVQTLKTKLKKCKTQTYIPCLKNQGTKYYGQCLQSIPNGYGIKQSQQQIYEGYWKNGKQDGQGKLTIKNKFEIEGIWSDGIMVEYKLK